MDGRTGSGDLPSGGELPSGDESFQDLPPANGAANGAASAAPADLDDSPMELSGTGSPFAWATAHGQLAGSQQQQQAASDAGNHLSRRTSSRTPSAGASSGAPGHQFLCLMWLHDAQT